MEDIAAHVVSTMRHPVLVLKGDLSVNLRAVQLLLGPTKLESRYLGVEVDDALCASRTRLDQPDLSLPVSGGEHKRLPAIAVERRNFANLARRSAKPPRA